MDHLSKFHLNQTVNKPGNPVLQKLHRLEKWWHLVPRSQEPGAWRYKTSARQYLLRKNMKNSIFVNKTPHASLGNNSSLPGGS